jgi:hypothetical protein
VALGDLDSDGDLDIVVGNLGQTSRYYLNNGRLDPFDGVAGGDFAADAPTVGPVALGDMNGDGNLDIVAGGALLTTNRLYLHNGTPDPFTEVNGIEIGADADHTLSVALGDVDCDGDLDVVAGNSGLFVSGAINRLYLNNGTADPFAEVTGSNLTDDLHDTKAVALGDVDGDGDLDAVAGNRNAVNRLYRNLGTSNPFDGGTDITPDRLLAEDVAVGDVDGDGDIDLVLTNGFQGRFTRLLLNNGTEAPFTGVVGSDIATDASASADIEMQDFNGDGRLDLAISHFAPPLYLYLNNGSADPFAGVQGKVISSTVSFRAELVSGDLDMDGDVDLVADAPIIRDSVFLNNGSSDPFAGVSPSRIGFATEIFTIQVMTLGDLDRDGDLDLVIGTGPSLLDRFFLNNGTSEPFAGVAGSALGTATGQTFSVALGDMDGDGELDILTSSLSPNFPNLLYLNNGSDAPFAGVTPIDIGSDLDVAAYLAIGDVDGNGDLDLVITNGAVGDRLFLNNGTSNPFDGVESIALSGNVGTGNSVALADFDRDGDMDLAVGGSGARRSQLYLNNSPHDPLSQFVLRDITVDNDLTRSVSIGDVDRDGDPDLVLGNLGQPNRLYLNDGKIEPSTGADITTDALQTTAVALGDVDKDGDLDLVAGNFGQPNRFYPNNGGPDPFANISGTNITPDADLTTSVALGDVDRDGDLDLVAGNFGQANRLYLNNGTSEPWNGVSGVDIATDAHDTNAVALGDVNRDGYLDLVVVNFGQTNRLYLNNRSGDPFAGVTGSDISTDADNTNSVALGDVNKDGYLDLVAGNFGQPNRYYQNNRSADPFAGVMGSEISSDVGNTEEVALADVNRDGNLDLVVGNLGQPNRIYFSSDSDPSLPFDGAIGVEIASDAHNTRSVAIADLDRDGSLDIVAGNDGQTSRIYTRRSFCAPESQATSLVVDTKPNNIHKVVLDTEQTLPPNTSIDYWVSADGGLRWSLVQLSEVFTFPTPGSDLRWRAVLRSLSPAFSPRLETLYLDLGPGIEVNPGTVDFMTRIVNTGPSAPETVTITNEGESNVTIAGVLLGGGDTGEFAFSNDSGESNLIPGATRTFDVDFNPSSLGIKTSTVTITSDDLDRPTLKVSLMGVGIELPTPISTPTPSFTPTATASPIQTQTATTTGLPTNSPTPEETNYDIHPEVPDGVVNAGDLLEWLQRLEDPESGRSLLFDFARFWKSAVD